MRNSTLKFWRLKPDSLKSLTFKTYANVQRIHISSTIRRKQLSRHALSSKSKTEKLKASARKKLMQAWQRESGHWKRCHAMVKWALVPAIGLSDRWIQGFIFRSSSEKTQKKRSLRTSTITQMRLKMTFLSGAWFLCGNKRTKTNIDQTLCTAASLDKGP